MFQVNAVSALDLRFCC